MVLVLFQSIGGFKGDLLGVVVDKVVYVMPVSVSVIVSVWEVPPPSDSLDLNRMQLRADSINRYLYSLYRGFIDEGGYVVGIVDGDGYVEGLNFVFGLATPTLRVATVYVSRLWTTDIRLYVERLAKEVAHELGHLLGLSHCPDKRCVMSFSNTLNDVDRKRLWFCPSCRAKLVERWKHNSD